MDIPQVQISGFDSSHGPGNAQKAETRDVDMDSSQHANDAITQDVPLSTEITELQPKEAAPPKRNPGLQFLEYLKSPIVELTIGKGETKTTLTAHQKLLLESPFLAERVAVFHGSGPRRIELPDEDVEAFGFFLQFQYTRNYASSLADASSDEDAAVGETDDSGEQLLKHARVYTLAEKLGIPALKTLAHSKIHRVNSTSHGEIAYARYVYTHTPADDATIRKPVASFWALRSHVLRHEAEEEFRKLCLEVPEFCFDVFSMVLDHKEKRAQDKAESESAIKGSGRKRLRSGL
ncbi:hypothetical protein ANOM_005747 [Aspergillus nomiae NRRL 13137]|uniref:BTB domain-containing protein n=1 Tax=Aspergillus nomiae NRRL (strain ATCC 15546 / NRRL 13137 / CBS 260.88 / M93) TaxID=1509407 RepID=A0A0L1J180_ASPN3|nr:uncharacterized protein ANOM_005747 [Aspergillus nomiae NRRL 13137]KNG85499.1 hypothetical protein ANOM_005747 [Aspergillus nomiae NRRL 13137]